MNLKAQLVSLLSVGKVIATKANAASYFDYNYCEMAHTIQEYYEIPNQLAELEYVTIIMRHTARTPANVLPHEDLAWNCENLHQYRYVQSDTSKIPIINSVIIPEDNPFVSRYWKGTCQTGQITRLGLNQAIQFGQDVWKVYGEMLNFLPKKYDPELLFFQTSTSTRTRDVAGGLIAGLYPDAANSDITIYQEPVEIDPVEPGFSCNKYQSLLSAAKTTAEWKAHLEQQTELKSRLDDILDTQGLDDWSSWYDHYFDVFRTRQCHDLPLPCKVTDRAKCVTSADANLVYEIGNWEYNYLWNQQTNATYMTSLRMGPWLDILRKTFWRVSRGEEGARKFRWYVAHDGSMANLVGALGIQKLLWPGWGANLFFELWKVPSGERFVRVLYNGQPLLSKEYTWAWVSLDEFLLRLDRVIPRNPLDECVTT